MVKYYIVDAGDVNAFLPYMEAALGHPNIAARYSLDNTLALLKFNENNLPPGYNGIGYTADEVRAIMSTATWSEAGPPLDSKTRHQLAKAYGKDLLEDLYSQIDEQAASGSFNPAQLEATLNQYENILGLLERGFFGLLLYKNSQTPINGNAVLTQGQINTVLASIGQWEQDHPRS